MKRGGVAERLMLAILPAVAALVIRCIHFCLRREVIGAEHPRHCWAQGERVIFAFWHDQLLLMAKCYQGNGAKVLISPSRDGELIARTMRHFGLGTVRGSSRRGGRAAFRALVDLGRAPFDLAITPDGPKGPRHQLKDGVVELARITGRPIIPLCFVSSRGRRFNSWDRFLLPYPFGRGVYAYGAPLYYAKGEGGENFRDRLQQAMAENEAEAVARLRSHGVHPV